MKEDQLKESIRILHQHAENNKHDLDLREQILITLLNQKENHTIISELIDIIGDNVHSTQFHWDLIARIMNRGFADTLIVILQDDNSPENSFKINYLLGLIYQWLERSEDSILNFEKAISENPDFADAYYNLANVYKTQGDDVKAIELLKKSIELDANLAEPHFALATIYFKFHQYEEEKKHLNTFIKLANDYLYPYKMNAYEFLRVLNIITGTR